MRTIPSFSWLAATLALLLPATTTLAHPRGSSAPYSLSVEDEWGRPLRTYHHGGETFVLGEYGTRYQIRVHNRTGRRVEAVITVDGRDAVSGDPGDFVKQRGYVIGAYDSVAVDGFRQSLDRVATFRFTRPGNSYSSRMGTPENVGVIGVAIFPEKRPEPRPAIVRPPRPEYRSSAPTTRYRDDGANLGTGYGGHGVGSARAEANKGRRGTADSSASEPAAASPAPRASAEAERSQRKSAPADAYEGDSYSSYVEEAPRNNLGTEYGESRDSQVREVGFRRDDRRHPAQVLAVRYDDEQGLMARGIELHPRPVVVQREPEPFPANRFAAPPPY